MVNPINRVKAIAGLQDVKAVLFEHLTTGVSTQPIYVWVVETYSGEKLSVFVCREYKKVETFSRYMFVAEFQRRVYMTSSIMSLIRDIS